MDALIQWGLGLFSLGVFFLTGYGIWTGQLKGQAIKLAFTGIAILVLMNTVAFFAFENTDGSQASDSGPVIGNILKGMIEPLAPE